MLLTIRQRVYLLAEDGDRLHQGLAGLHSIRSILIKGDYDDMHV